MGGRIARLGVHAGLSVVNFMNGQESFAKRMNRLTRLFGWVERVSQRESERMEADYQRALSELEQASKATAETLAQEELRLRDLLDQSGKEYSQKKYQMERELNMSRSDIERATAEWENIHKIYEAEYNHVKQDQTNLHISHEKQKSALNDLYSEKKQHLLVTRAKLLEASRQSDDKLKRLKEKTGQELSSAQTEGQEKVARLRDQVEAKQKGWQIALETMKRELEAIRQEKEHTEKRLATVKGDKEKELESARIGMKLAKEQLEVDRATLVERAEEDQRACEREIEQLKQKIEAEEKALQDLIVRTDAEKKQAEEGFEREEGLLKEAVKTEAEKRDYEQKLYEQEKTTKEKELARLKDEYEKKKWYWDNQIRTLMMQKSVQDAEYDAERLRVDREARTHLRGLEAKRDELRQRVSDLRGKHESLVVNGKKEQEVINQRWRFRRDRLWTMWQNRLDVLKKERTALQEQIEALEQRFSKDRLHMIEAEKREEGRADDLSQFIQRMTDKNLGQRKQREIQFELEKTRIIAQIKECESLVVDWMDRMKLTQDEVLRNNAQLAQDMNYLDRWYSAEEKETQLFLNSLQKAMSLFEGSISQTDMKNAA